MSPATPPDDASERLTHARLAALTSATWDVVYRMSADWAEMQPLDGRGLVPSTDRPLRDWMTRNLPADEHPRVKAAIARAVAHRTVFELEHRVLRPDGTEGWTHSRAVPIVDDDGTLVEWLGVARDVTAARRAREALEASEQRFRAVFEQSTGGIAQTDLEGRFVLANDRFCEIVGRPRENLLTLRMQDLTHPDDLPRNIALFRELADGTRDSFTVEKRYVRPDGSHVWVQNAVSAMRGDDGRVRHLSAMVADITDLRAAREAQASVAAERQLALDAARLGWWHYDPHRGQVSHDARYAEIYGLDGPGPRTIDEIGALLHPEDAPRLWAAVEAATRPDEPEPYAVEYRIRRPDGTVRWLEARGLASFRGRGASREVDSFVGTVADVTDRRLAEEALAEASRRKDEFLATLAHELRNPLAPISNALQVWPLLEHRPEDAARLREMMGRQVHQMARLIDDLLDVSRITRGRIDLRRERLDLRAALGAAIEAQKPFLDANRHRLAVDLPGDPLMVHADPVRLVQIFGNLLHNAAKYTPPSGDLGLAAVREPDGVRVTVSDSGAGIPADMLTSIFEMFTQVDQTIGRTHGGLGIGLTLVKSLVELHGGRIGAESDGPGQGSRFTVRLPALADEAPDVSPPSPGAYPETPLPARRVLVVDDIASSADTFALLLQGLGQDALAAYDGPSALAAVARFRPDVAFLDLAMPGMDGYDVARRLRAAGDAPVLVALTGYGQEEDRLRALAAGFDHHLVKPASLSAVCALLAGLGRA